MILTRAEYTAEQLTLAGLKAVEPPAFGSGEFVIVNNSPAVGLRTAFSVPKGHACHLRSLLTRMCSDDFRHADEEFSYIDHDTANTTKEWAAEWSNIVLVETAEDLHTYLRDQIQAYSRELTEIFSGGGGCSADAAPPLDAAESVYLRHRC